MLGVFAVGKLATPYQSSYALPRVVYYGAACAEAVLATMLVCGWRHGVATIVTVFLFAIGMILAVAVKGDCG